MGIGFLLTCVCLFGQMQIENSAADNIAQVGDTVTFTVSGLADMPEQLHGQLVTNMLKYEKLQFDRKGKSQIVYKTKVKDPGVILLAVCAQKDFGGDFKNAVRSTVAVSPEKVKPSSSAAKDTLAYWENMKKEMAKIPATPKLKLISDKDGVELYEFEIDAGEGELGSPAGIKAIGYMGKPVGDGPFPAIISFYGAGSFEAYKGDALRFAKMGAMSWSLNPHPLPNDTPQDVRDEYRKGKRAPLAGYNQFGKDTRREDVYFNGMFKRDYQVVQAIKQSPYWNKKELVVRGFSQGGAQSLATAFLCPEVTALAPQCPAMCDIAGNLVGRKSGWPFWVKTPEDKKQLEISRSFDMVNFAPHMKAKMLVAAGLRDGACPPAGQMALFNEYAGPKEIVFMPDVGHGKNDDWTRREWDFLREALGLN